MRIADRFDRRFSENLQHLGHKRKLWKGPKELRQPATDSNEVGRGRRTGTALQTVAAHLPVRKTAGEGNARPKAYQLSTRNCPILLPPLRALLWCRPLPRKAKSISVSTFTLSAIDVYHLMSSCVVSLHEVRQPVWSVRSRSPRQRICAQMR